MFKVRREQMEAYQATALRAFEEDVAKHVARCLPDQHAALGDDGVRQVIRAGVARAARHGIVAERDVCKFIDLMLVFGIDFDERCPWAREILSESLADRPARAPAAASPRDPFARMRRLFERALEEA